MASKKDTKKGAGKPASVITRTKVRDGVIVGEEISIDLTTGDTAAELDAIRKLFPTVAEQVQAYADRAQKVIDDGTTGSRLKYAQDAIWQARELIRYLDKGDAPGAVQHALWMMQCVWRVDIKGVEPTIITGAKRRQAGDRGRETQSAMAADEVERLQSKADSVWAVAPTLSRSAVAKKIAPTRWDSVRKVLKKPGS